MGKTFKELQVWQRSVALATEVYRVTENFPKHELYGLSMQMRRAVVSIASNIAEGAGRHFKADFRHFICMARGSNQELQTQLIIAANLGLVPSDALERLEAECEEIAKMLHGLESFLVRPPVTKTKTPN